MITIDQRGCGQGKTTDGIYKRIHANIQKNTKSLIVVPSINLQEQYKKDLGKDYTIQIINSNLYNDDSIDFNTTIQATLHHMKLGTDIIIITHQAFVKLPKTSHKMKYDLIIDEALEDIIRKTSVIIDSTDVWKPDFDLYNLFEFENNIVEKIIETDIDNDEDWYELHQYRNPTQTLISDSPSFRSITDKNYVHHVTSKGWHTLTGQSGGTINVISVLNPDVLKNWHNVYIAAANFFYTKMGVWLVHNNFQYYTPKGYEFVKHVGNIKLHTSNDSKFNWSNTKRQNYPDILGKYHDYVKSNASGDVITIRNNSEKQHLGNIEIRVNHNVHGQNNLQEYVDISLETALIPDPQVKKFIIDKWLSPLSKYEQNRCITHMFSCYLFYQTIMRTKLRSREYNNELINIFVLDQDTGVCLMDYFEPNIQIGEMDITSHITWKKRGAPVKYISDEDKKQAKKEYNKAQRNKRKMRE
jgi:hypothetical protein